MSSIELQLVYVKYMPKVLDFGVLYYSEEYNTACHLCPCGCNTKIVTPIRPVNWSLTVKDGKATLNPSIGNWQIPCRSHYWIIDGKIDWSYQWSEERILRGYKQEESRTKAYFDKKEEENPLSKKRKKSFIAFLKRLFSP